MKPGGCVTIEIGPGDFSKGWWTEIGYQRRGLLERAYGWVHQAAHLLANAEQRSGAELRQAYSALLAEMSAQRATLPVV